MAQWGGGLKTKGVGKYSQEGLKRVRQHTVLVVDDDKDIVEAVSIYLGKENLQVEKAYDGCSALAQVEQGRVDLVLMDIMMPRMDGIQAMMKLRQAHNIPVILLSAKSQDTDKILGLDLGADDYITKPFNPLELVARVKSQLRRYTELGMAKERREVLHTGGLCLDTAQKQLTVDGQTVKITPLEYNILLLLMQHPGQVFSIEEIYEKAWKEPSFAPENTVAVHIRRIREKIEINPKDPKYLKVVWGIGYKIEKI